MRWGNREGGRINSNQNDFRFQKEAYMIQTEMILETNIGKPLNGFKN